MSCNVAYEKAKLLILPLPYEGHSSYGLGAYRAPKAILEASQQLQHFDEELLQSPISEGIFTLPSLEIDDDTDTIFSRITSTVSEHAPRINQGTVFCSFGGNHAITAPLIRGFAPLFPKLSVLQLDAHADVEDSYDGTPQSHFCVMRRVREHVPVVAVGIRSLSATEHEFLTSHSSPVFSASQVLGSFRSGKENHLLQSMLASLSDTVYLSIDVDVFDPSIIPATGTPEPGGLYWEQVLTILREVARHKHIVGFDLVELTPHPYSRASDFTVTRLCYKLFGYIKKV